MTLTLHRFILLWSLIILAACSSLPNLGGEQVEGSPDEPVQQMGRTPEETARLFLDAWSEEDFETMYSLISPRLLTVYMFEDFRAQYANTHGELSFNGIEYELHDVEMQGMSAAIHYDVAIQSNSFETIADDDRIMRLVHEGEGWHVAWSPMDIFSDMTSTVRIRSDRRFPPRGTIYDRNGLPLVQNEGAVGIYLREQDLRDEDLCYDLLASFMMRPTPYFVTLGTNYLPDAVFFAGEMDGDLYSANRQNLDSACGLDIDSAVFGSKVRQASGRNYYGHGAAAHITGYTGRVQADQLSFWESQGYTSSDIVGQEGIERVFQNELAGQPEQFLRLIDTSGGVPLRELGGAVGSDSTSVQLTIDRQMQLNLARAFNDGWNYAAADWSSVATGGGGVVMDVNSGAVLAMFSYPTFDPRIFNPDSLYYQTNTTYAAAPEQIGRATTGDPFFPVGSALNNRTFAEQYSPGSTFKIVTALAAADTGIWTRDETFDCELIWEGRERFGDALEYREDWRVALEEEAAGPVTIMQALTTSCNPFFWEVGALMFQRDRNTVMNYAQLLGFNQQTGLFGLLNEAKGNIPQPGDVTEALNNAIGQGNTQVTILQMARLTSAIANGGTLYKPYIVEQVGGFDGDEVQRDFEPEITRTLDVSEEALAIVREGMCAVPIDREFGTSYSIFNGADVRPSYTSCGKTGTAQSGAFAPHSWYVTFAPAENPQIAIAVLVTNSREGSEVAAPIVRRFLDTYFDAQWADWPGWWRTPYVPLTPPQGVVAGSGG